MMKAKVFSLKNAARFFALAICVCSVAFLASCDPTDVPIEAIDRIEVNALELVNRETTDEPGKLVYTDQVSVTATVFYKAGDETKSEDIKKETTLTSEAAWSATAVTISALTGEIAKRATITASEAGVTLDFGAFKAENYAVFTNPSYAFTHEGKSVDLPFYGFNSASVSADAGIVVETVTEGDKEYDVTVVTQAFKIKHTDGTEKEITAVFEYKAEQEDLGDIIKIEEISFENIGYGTTEGVTGYWWYKYLYTYRVTYEKGTKDLTYEHYSEASYYPDKKRIFTDFVAPTSFSTSWYIRPGEHVYEIPHLYQDVRSFNISDPTNDTYIFTFSFHLVRARYRGGEIYFSLPDPELVGSPRTEAQDSYEENINGVLHVVTPYTVTFTLKWGAKHQGDYSCIVEECKAKS